MTEPRLSVVVPARNAGRYLGEALASLRVGGRVDEIVVVDDASDDDTLALAKGGADRVIRLAERRGAGGARNAGLELVTGDWIGFLDADDLWEPFSRQDDPRLQRLAAEPDLPGCLGPLRLLREGALLSEPYRVLSLGTLVVRREVFAAVGGFDESLEQCEDLDWFQRAADAGLVFGWIAQPVYRYRRHATNTTRDPDLRRGLFLAGLKHTIDRRRRERLNP